MEHRVTAEWRQMGYRPQKCEPLLFAAGAAGAHDRFRGERG